MSKKIKDLKDLKFDDKNINKGSEYGGALLTKSLQEVGAGRSVLADKNGVLIAGNKTVEKFGEAGLTKIKVIETTGDELVVVQRTDLDINSPQGAKMKILDNTVSKHNYIEDAEVAEAICEEFDLEPVELGLQDKPTELEAQEDDFDVPEGGIETDIVLGDLFEIGEHRLLCGDSTDSDQVAKLMNGEKADLLLTDPPYGIGIDGQKESKAKNPKHNRKHHEFRGWDNARPEQSTFELILSFANQGIIWGGNYFADLLPATRGWIYWSKGQDGLTMSDGELAWTTEDKPLRAITVNRAALQGSVHPTQKPIEVMSFCIKWADKAEFILDTFLGSGSTMVASHQLKRKCYGMELDPKYCQVIIDRMRKLDPNIEIKRNGKPYIPNHA